MNGWAITSDGTISEPRRLRMLKGLSQERLADLAGVSWNTLVALEVGRQVSPQSVKLVADALGTTLEQIAIIATKTSLVARTRTIAEAYQSLCNRCGGWS